MERKSVNYVIGEKRIEGWALHYFCIIDEKSGTFAFYKFPEEYIDPIGYNRNLLVAQVKPVMAQKLDLQEKEISIEYLATQKINIDDETQRYNNYFALSVIDDESELLQKEFYINETHHIWLTEDPPLLCS